MQQSNLRMPSMLITVMLSLLFCWTVMGIKGEQATAAPSDKAVRLQVRDGVPDQYIVVFNNDVSQPKGLAEALAKRHGFTLRHTYAVALKGFAAQMPAAVAQALAHHPQVAYIEQDLYAHAVAQTTATGVKRIGTELNGYANIDGKDERVAVDVAIIDTGIDLDHPDLNVVQPCFTAYATCNDGHGHGTHVAGIVGALDNGFGAVGVAPGARLHAVKVLDDNGSAPFSTVIQGIDFVTAHADVIAVANMSLGGNGYLASLRTAIQNSVAAGVVYVVAAGNNGADIYGGDSTFDTGLVSESLLCLLYGIGCKSDFIPAAYPEVAAVSALSDSDGRAGGIGLNTSYGPDDTLATFSNFSSTVVAGNPVATPGAGIDLAAPGVDIFSTWKDGGYNTISGTSMASPHVAGTVALYIAANGRAYNAAEVYAIRQALIDSAQPQTAWGPADSMDPDPNPEPLVNAAGGSAPPPNNAPVVTITSPTTDGTEYNTNDNITFTATADDPEDGDLAADIAWASDLDGSLHRGASFSTATLSAGTHTITASVKDSDGKMGSDTITITVAPPSAEPIVSLASITYAKKGSRFWPRLLITIALVDDHNAPVSGASVSILLKNVSYGLSWTATGTTGVDGTETFILNPAFSGHYTTDVTDVAADGYTWDGDGTSMDPGFDM